MLASSACGRPRPPRLPPFAPWRRRSSAWSGLWFQHHSEPSIALPLHRSPLALMAVHLLNRAYPLPPPRRQVSRRRPRSPCTEPPAALTAFVGGALEALLAVLL